MNLSEYFETAEGLGILSTADSSGRVNSAVYGRPHVIDEETVAFIMAERLTYSNLRSNPSALYLFKEAGEHYKELLSIPILMIKEFLSQNYRLTCFERH